MKENRKFDAMRCDDRQCDVSCDGGGGDLVVERCLRRGSLSWPVEGFGVVPGNEKSGRKREVEVGFRQRTCPRAFLRARYQTAP